VTGAGLVTLLFTDLVGSTELAQRLGEDAAEEFRRVHFGLLRAAVAEHGGREVKNLGDGLMVAFAGAPAALAAAVSMQRAVAGHNRSGDGPPFAVRVGVQAGEPVRDGEDYFGTPVIVAKRLCDRAVAGQILTTGDVAALFPRREGPVLRAVGALDLKGLADPVATVEVMWDGVPRTPEPAAAPAVHVVRPPALAPPPDPFLGRDSELATLAGLLRRARLVTIVGPGGVGKTRLCGHLVDAVAADYPGGVWCCALASVGSNEQVPDAVATALRVERRSGVELVDRLVDFLAPKRALLVLDNCEQVIEGVAALCAAVLAGTSAVDVLVTTRESLGVPGEHRVPLDPLAVDGPGAAGAPAVALFLERAAAAGRRLGEADLPAVRELCRRVDGLPLAIELAAARVASRTVAEIVADVTDRLAELSVRRGRAERHRSIHALVDWSYGLLDDADRRVFERLSVFAGGADAEAVAAVMGAPVLSVPDRLQGLADQSLVSTRAHETGTRYALLEPVRAYAAVRLRERGDELTARDAHAAWFATLAERADAGIRGPQDREWISRLDLELANLRVAHGHLLATGDADRALGMAATHFWCGYLMGASETLRWAEQAAERFAGRTGPALAMAWATVAFGALFRGDLPRSAELAARSIAIVGRGAHASRLSLLVEATIPVYGGDFARAVELYEEAATVSRAAGDTFLLAVTHGAQAMALAYAGRAEEAARVADEGLAIAREHGNATLRALTLYYAGEARLDSAPEEAEALLEEALAEARRAGTRFVLGVAGLSAASLQTRRGEPAAALARYPALLEHWQRSGTWAQQWLTLRTLIEALTGAGHPGPAAVLYGAMSASPRATPLIGQDAVRLGVVRARLGEVLGDADLTRRQEEGAALGDAGAVAYAHRVLREILAGGA
jgi:predicted ATPase/class 3 adenylate cyclase